MHKRESVPPPHEPMYMHMDRWWVASSALESVHTAYCYGYCAQERRETCLRYVALLMDEVAGIITREGNHTRVRSLYPGTCTGNVHYVPIQQVQSLTGE